MTRSVPTPDETRLPPAVPGVLRGVVDRLVDAFHPLRIYLFGSQARGDARSDSDYDLMVIVPSSSGSAALPGFKRDRIAYRALLGIPVPKDVMVWTEGEFTARLHLPASLPATVAREGRVIYDLGQLSPAS